jgi:hypothetical protein
VATEAADFLELIHQLEGVEQTDGPRYSTFKVHGRTTAYYWPRTSTVGLRQLVAEQLALVAERPEVFEVMYTSAGFGWVVVYLDGVDRVELAELTYEAWRLSAPSTLVEERGDRLPR